MATQNDPAIRVARDLYEKVDEFVVTHRKQGYSRSGFVQEAIEYYFAQLEGSPTKAARRRGVEHDLLEKILESGQSRAIGALRNNLEMWSYAIDILRGNVADGTEEGRISLERKIGQIVLAATSHDKELLRAILGSIRVDEQELFGKKPNNTKKVV